MTAQSTALSGTSMPPMPIERTNGTGSATRTARPIATVIPDSSTARPAVATVRAVASTRSAPARISSRKRDTTSSA